MEFLIAAISLGFLGSFHCIGMCGPIALSLPVNAMPLPKKILSIFAYNFGRIITYTIFGALFGLIGQSFFLFGFQQKLSLTLGLLILLGLILSSRFVNKPQYSNNIYKMFNNLKTVIAHQFQKRGIKTFFSIGLLNGLLPCGLVYLGIAGAVSTGSVLKGALFMAAFGASTLPLMFAVSYSNHLITLKMRMRIRKLIPGVVGLMAILLVLRGLNLGINYISPRLVEDKTMTIGCKQQLKCCHKK